MKPVHRKMVIMKMLPDKTTIPINRIVVDVNMPKVETDKKKEQTFKMKKVTIKNFFDQCLDTLAGKSLSVP